jgi:hypothetical protein
MATNPQEEAKKAKKELQGINEIVGALDDGFQSLTSRLTNVVDELKDASGEATLFSRIQKDTLSSLNSISRANERLIKNQIDLNNGSLSSKKITEQIKNITATRELLQQRLNNLLKKQIDGLRLTEDELREIDKLQSGIAEVTQEVTDNYNEQLKAAQKIESKLGSTGKLLKGISKIPVLGNLIDAEEALAAAQAEATNKASSQASIMGAAFKSLGGTLKSTLTDPLFQIGLSLKILKELYDIGISYSKITAEIAKNQGINSNEAARTQSYLRDIASNSKDTLITTKNLVEATNNLNSEFGTSADFTGKILEDNLKLTKNLGLTVDEASAFAKFSIITGNTQENIVNSIGKQNKGVISNKKVLSEVAKVNGQLYAQYKGSPDLLAKAVIQTQKLGLTLQQAQSAAKGLLNFEDSISSELEAELLTGKNLNLERARALALQGDSAGAAEELMKNVGTLADFTKLNVLQQESLAKAVGMTTDELTDSLVKREVIKNLDKNQVALYQTQIKQLRDKGQIEKANALEQQMLSGKSLELANVQADAQERLTRAGDKFKDVVSSIVAGPLGGMVEKLVSLVEKIVSSPIGKVAVTAAAVVGLAAGLAAFSKMMFKVVKNGAVPVTIEGGGAGGGDISDMLGGKGGGGFGGGIGRITKAFSKGGLKGGGKAISRILGKTLKGNALTALAMGGIEAGTNLAEGKGAGESIGRALISGLASFGGGALGSLILPGAGTIGGGIAGGLLGDKIADSIFGTKEPAMATGGIVSKPTRALIGEAGPEAVVPLNQLMAEFKEMKQVLVQILHKEGTITLNGTKMGTAMAVGSYKIQ